MKFERWFWKVDTPAWSRNVGRFLLLVSVVILLVVIWRLVR